MTPALAELAHATASAPVALVVHGDNLDALRALERAPAAPRPRLVYCDPPYNTGRSLEHYDDARSVEAWRAHVHERLTAAHALLPDDGVLALQIGSHSLGHAQLLLDDVFGASHRLGLAVVKMSELSGVKMAHAAHRLPSTVEFLFLYGRSRAARLRVGRRRKADDVLARYLKYYTRIIDNPDDPVPAWRIVPLRDAMRAAGHDPSQPDEVRRFQLENADRVVYRTNARALAELRFATPTAEVFLADGSRRVWWEGKQMLFLADHLDEWLGDLWTEFSTINLRHEGGVPFPNGKKPEALIRRVIELATEPGELVLDPWAGSGTVPAVALKLGRSCVAMESGPQAHTHIVRRLDRVVSGDDTSGISRELAWRGGGRWRAVAPHELA